MFVNYIDLRIATHISTRSQTISRQPLNLDSSASRSWRIRSYLPQRSPQTVYMLQRGVQWKQGVVICMVLYTMLLCNTTQIHCTPLPLHPPVINTQRNGLPIVQVSLSCWSDSPIDVCV